MYVTYLKHLLRELPLKRQRVVLTSGIPLVQTNWCDI